MIRSNHHVFADLVFRIVPELGTRFWKRDVMGVQKFQNRVKADGSETDEDADVLQKFKFAGEIGKAVGKFLRRRLVVRRGTTGGGSDIHIVEFETIAARNGMRLITKPGAVEHAE